MKPITVAIAGCGGRGMLTYADCIKKGDGRMKIVAAADIRPGQLAAMREHHGLTEDQCYESAEAMLEQPKLADVMFICTPDRCHYHQAIAALKKGYHLLLEKPAAHTADMCREIERVAKENDRQVVVCHVLRYTVFYQKLKELLDQGAVGEIRAIQAIERVAHWHQAHSFVRGNWRNSDETTPMILQKCCHDMDILLWLTGRHCSRVTSFGHLSHFTPEHAPENAAMRCIEDCPAAANCPYNAVKFYLDPVREGRDSWAKLVMADPTPEKMEEALRTGSFGRCVYRCDNNVVDHQVVNLEMDNGLTVSFTMTAFTKECARNMRIMGTEGEIWADMETNMITVMPFVGEKQEIDVTKLTDDFSGHAGGDARMITDLCDLLDGTGMSGALTSIDRSVESHIIALAAEESRLNNGCIIEL